mgnify:CR=1 FL=1
MTSASPAVAPPPRLLGLATAVPPHRLPQAAVRARMLDLFDSGRGGLSERLAAVFDNAGIATRYSCMPLDWYGSEIGWAARNRLYETHATDLLAQTAERVLASAGLMPGDIDALVTVSTTGLATPSLDARLMNRLPFRRDLRRLPVFGLGCCGGVLGLNRAAELAAARPGQRVLLLTVELCALTFRPRDRRAANVVASALFGDGAAGAVLSTHPEDQAAGPAVVHGSEHTWPDSEDVMGWEVQDDGLGVRFSRDIPRHVAHAFAAVLDDALAAAGLARAALGATACHPGGAKVITALEQVFGLAEGDMTAARRVLRDYGNMSAPTVLFVLREVLAARPQGPVLASALGPGFTAGFTLLDPAPAAAPSWGAGR